MNAYYNEVDPKAAAWLRELIKRGLIAHGEVDERSIIEVQPDDVRGFTQCHFFAGIGGWSYALRLADWPDGRPVWTGSCPCQPFSAAGKGAGKEDATRHLWPAWERLIRECKPATLFGEQVGAAIGYGWLDDVFLSLEQSGYACGAAVFPACSVGAPHIRSRLYFVADAGSERRQQIGRGPLSDETAHGRAGRIELESDCDHIATGGFATGELADSEHPERWPVSGHREDERDGHDDGRQEAHGIAGACSEVRGMADSNGRNASAERLQRSGEHGQQQEDGGAVLVGDADNARSQGRRLLGADRERDSTDQRIARSPSATNGFWSDAEWIACRDGKSRPVEPGVAPLAHGVPNRVVKLRGYGNAINAEQARHFIEAFNEIKEGSCSN